MQAISVVITEFSGTGEISRYSVPDFKNVTQAVNVTETHIFEKYR